MLSPYRFTYSNFNPSYNFAAKDRWGNYKEQDANRLNGQGINLSNHEFPYVIQNRDTANKNSTAWNLTQIRLPSGGGIKVSYESDDYAYVQDRRAMDMLQVEGVGVSPTFEHSNALYRDADNPYLYVYFDKKKHGVVEKWFADMRKSYLGSDEIIQYNFKVKMSSRGERTASCGGTPLDDHIKGYAKVLAIGDCPSAGSETDRYSYIKLAPKNVQAIPALKSLNLGDIQLNPITLAGIFYAKYYNNNALYPASEIVSLDAGALIIQLISSISEIANFFRNPIAKYLQEGKAKYVDLSQSFIRLYSQGNKLGGGHRVKRIEFADNWNDLSAANNPVAVYGSEYDYTIKDPSNGKVISSGVATYEPLYGGDENPFKEPIAEDNIGQNRDFPAVIPTELTTEGPIGEALFPGASVGYSKVTITSIHKSEGESSQTIQEEEFYTAKDFPLYTKSGALDVLEDKPLKTFDLSLEKEEAYRVSQSFALYFNDMHGKMKAQTTYVAKGEEAKQLVSYKKYKYFTNTDGTLNNKVPCTSFEEDGSFSETLKTLGVETDLMIDNRAKDESSEKLGFAANLNTFMAGPIPITIPMPFPHIPEFVDKHFSSVVTTKVIQKYGILQSVETFDKGAAVVMTNERFDPNTGMALVTKVSTEHNDNEIQVKYPAYWAYRCMGAASHNILYEEDLNDINIIDGAMYVRSANHHNFNVGDELIVNYGSSCEYPNIEQIRKMWIVDMADKVPEPTVISSCKCAPNPNEAVSYVVSHYTCGRNRDLVDYNTAVTDVSTGILHEVICRLNRDNMVNYDIFMKADAYGEGQGSVGSFKQRIEALLSSTNNNNNVSYIKNLLLGASPYPIEALHYRNVHDGDFAEIGNVGSSYNYNHRSFKIGGVPYLVHLNSWGRWRLHGGCKSGATHSMTGTVSNIADYNSKYPTHPVVGRTKKILRLTMSFTDRADNYIYSTNTPTSLPLLVDTLFNPKEPHNLATNNFEQYDYVIDIPYDPSYPSCLTANDISNMGMDNVLYKTEELSLGGQVTRSLLPSGFYSIDRFPESSSIWHNGILYDKSFFKIRYYVSSKVEIVDRTQLASSNISALVLRPRNRNDIPDQGAILPLNDFIQKAHVKVVRSGRRNQLQENVQNVSLVSKEPFLYKIGPSYHDPLRTNFESVINISAQTYSDNTAISEMLKNPIADYNNLFVTGNRGTYRPDKQYDLRKSRDYPSTTDVQKGLLNNVVSFWSPFSSTGHKSISFLEPNMQASAMWVARMSVSLFSPYGLPLQVQDAANNTEATLYGYDNQLPISKVMNASWDNALFENFEDYSASNTKIFFFQNLLNRYLYFGTGSMPIPLSNMAATGAQKHTGQKALAVSSTATIPFPAYDAGPAAIPEGATPNFHFRGGRKYLFSYWQKVDQNSFDPASPPKVSLTSANIIATAKPKTPPIDGWVLYEGTVSLPESANGSTVNLSFNPGTYDDLRILPIEANMKCFVYHPTSRKLAATLDENHMASLFEYDAEGKLVRIKKETERGILTIKESRSGVHSMFPNSTNGTTLDLKAN